MYININLTYKIEKNMMNKSSILINYINKKNIYKLVILVLLLILY